MISGKSVWYLISRPYWWRVLTYALSLLIAFDGFLYTRMVKSVAFKKV